MRKEDRAKYNYKRIEIYLSPKDAVLFEKKAILYRNWGAFIRDAVKQFNDIGTHRKIEALNEMTGLYKKPMQKRCIGLEKITILFWRTMKSKY